MPGNSRGLRVLVVDDLSEMRVIIHRALSDRGYHVDVAATIEQARQMSPAGYDAVLVDAHLGPERGTDLVEAMLAEDPAAASRCLVMTGGPTGALPDGIAYLAKPFQLSELIEAVSALHQPAARPAAHREPGRATAARTQAGGAPDIGPHSLAPVPSAEHQAGAGPQACRLLCLTRRLRARERHELVDFLHDGPIQELTAVTLELQMTRRSMPDPGMLDRVLQRLDAAAGSLRWLVDGQWPFQAPETQLTTALQQRTAWLLAAPVTVDLGEPAAGLAATEMQVVVDVVELMLLAMVAGPPARAHVVLRIEAQLIRIKLALRAAAGVDQDIGDPEVARTALNCLASALGTSAWARLREPPWEAQLTLARGPAVPRESGQIGG